MPQSLAIAASSLTLASFFGWAVALLASLYFAAPLLVWLLVRHPRSPNVAAIEVSDIPPDILERWRPGDDELLRLGFGPAFHARIGPAANLTSSVRLRIHEGSGVVAARIAMLTAGRGLKMAYDELVTTDRSGTELLTNNSSMLGAFASVAEKVTISLPGTESLSDLYRAHLGTVAAFGSGTGFVEPTESSVRRDLEEFSERDLERQTRVGLFRLTPDGASYRPTLKGAYTMTWRQLPPLNWLGRRARDPAAGQAMAAAPASIPSTPTHHDDSGAAH